MPEINDDVQCSKVNDDGLPCQKMLHHAQNGEYWDHAGGHMYASNETMNNIRTMHVDATALLSGQPAGSHKPEDCTYDGFCSWRIRGLD